jgi:NADH dehydrogenase FAD-containing subunit
MTNSEIKVVVVGGGAAGIELSLAMRSRWGKLLRMTKNDTAIAPTQLSVILLDSNQSLMPGESPACRAALNKVMNKYEIEVQHNVMVNKVTSSHIMIDSEDAKGDKTDGEIAYTHCIWATGAEGKVVDLLHYFLN